MRCPRCSFEGDLVDGACPRCGYWRLNISGDSFSVGSVSRRYTLSSTPVSASRPLTVQKVKRGDVLREGRYRLIEQLMLPENQRGQGTAWLATDSQLSQGRVVIREVILPGEMPENKKQMVRSIALRLSELAQHPGFPKVLDVFSEQDDYFIVFQQIEGESLATLLRQQGGALPERTVAEYGRQLCEMLSILSRQQLPIVHGSISPETIIVSPDRSRVSLIHVPLLPPKEPAASNAPSGYRAPEQARGNIGPSSDLYAVAATLHYAVTGFDPNERMAFFHPPARRLNPTVTPGMEAILSRQLRLSPQQRYARPSEMQRDLSALIASYGPVSDKLVTPRVDPLRLDAIQMRQRSRNRTLLDVGIFAGVGIIVLFAFLLIYLRPFSGIATTSGNPTPNVTATTLAQQQALNAELALELKTYQQKGIGISDGRFAFDIYQGRNDSKEKKQAALAIQHGDLSSAIELLRKATTEDPTDGEAQIYNEDLHLLQTGAPYVTIVLGLPIDSDDADLSIDRNDMESAFLIQHKMNEGNLLPHGLKLRVLIDSSGANDEDVATVAQFITNRVANAGNLDHIIAVVGWPFSTQTINARDIIASVHLPLISQTASSVKLSHSSPYFFRVNPPDDLQGKTLGDVAVNQLDAKTILVLRDQTDSYSVSLADAFIANVKANKATAINNPDDYFSETNTTVQQYQKVVADAITNKVDLIFIAGLDVDAVRLAVAVGNAYRANPISTYLKNLRILGGDAVDTGLLLGQGNGPDAQLAVKFPQDIQRLIFTAFGHPDEWTFRKVPQSQQPSFFVDWVNMYQSSTVTAPAPDPGNDAMLTYDAFGVIIKAASLVNGTVTGRSVRDALASLGTGKIPAFQGVSGRILFDSNGNPIEKAIVVLEVKNNNGVNQIALLQIAGKFN
jgi:ABC-type branched-subunit amino acid transport system substrate-binding protein/serine/threonine protein kinase